MTARKMVTGNCKRTLATYRTVVVLLMVSVTVVVLLVVVVVVVLYAYLSLVLKMLIVESPTTLPVEYLFHF